MIGLHLSLYLAPTRVLMTLKLYIIVSHSEIRPII